MSPITGKGTHYEGPILGSSNAQGGLFRNVSADVTSRLLSKYKVWFEDFRVPMAPTADGLVAAGAGTGMNGSGWTVTVIGAAAGHTIGVIDRFPDLRINCGTAADTGYNLQHNFAITAAATHPYHDVWGPVVSTAPGWDNREFIFATRLNYVHTGAWASKFAIGVAVTDTALMTPGTGDIDAVTTGGATMFHVSEAGVLSGAQHRTGGTTLTLTTLKNPIDSHASPQQIIDNTFLDLGFRMSYGDSSDITDPKNYTEWYVNGRKIATTQFNNPMTSTQTYSISIEAMNGGGGTEAMDLAVDYIFTAVSRTGDAYNVNL